MAVRLAGEISILCPLERFSAISADYIDLARCPDNSAAAGANVFDTAVNGFLVAALGASLYRQTAGIDTVLAQVFLDPSLRLRGKCRNRPAVLGVFLDMEAVGLGGWP